jgi:hypothetical protein
VLLSVGTTFNVMFCAGCLWLGLTQMRQRELEVGTGVDQLYKQLVKLTGIHSSKASSGSASSETRMQAAGYIRNVVAFLAEHTSKARDRESAADMEEALLGMLDPIGAGTGPGPFPPAPVLTSGMSASAERESNRLSRSGRVVPTDERGRSGSGASPRGGGAAVVTATEPADPRPLDLSPQDPRPEKV